MPHDPQGPKGMQRAAVVAFHNLHYSWLASLCSCGDQCDLHHSVHRGKLVPYPILHQILRRPDQAGAIASLQREIANVSWACREDRNPAIAHLFGAWTL